MLEEKCTGVPCTCTTCPLPSSTPDGDCAMHALAWPTHSTSIPAEAKKAKDRISLPLLWREGACNDVEGPYWEGLTCDLAFAGEHPAQQRRMKGLPSSILVPSACV